MSNDPQVERVGDTQLTSINVTAATPDVMNRICSEICDRVMEQIPDEALTKIAEEVIKGGKLVYRHTSGHGYHSRTEDVEIEVGNLVREKLGHRISQSVHSLIEVYWQTDEVKALVHELATKAFTECMANLPQVLAANFYQKMLGTVNGNQTDVIKDLTEHASKVGFNLDDLHNRLMLQTQLDLRAGDSPNNWYAGRHVDQGVAGHEDEA